MENLYVFAVVPHAGTWIEIDKTGSRQSNKNWVVPHAGTWIEILIVSSHATKSLVVPHAGTWIEIVLPALCTV